MIAIYFNANNDKAGRPRRCWAIVDEAGIIVDAVDEGYNGNAELCRKYPGIVETMQLATTPAEYRRLLKLSRASCT